MNLSDARKRRGLSGKEVAAALGVTAAALSNYEHGIRPITADKLISLSGIYDCSTDYLLGILSWDEECALRKLRVSLRGLTGSGMLRVAEYADDLKGNPKWSRSAHASLINEEISVTESKTDLPRAERRTA